jgi:predicted  nucleic acid-binding Zn-ribbon protein
MEDNFPYKQKIDEAVNQLLREENASLREQVNDLQNQIFILQDACNNHASTFTKVNGLRQEGLKEIESLRAELDSFKNSLHNRIMVRWEEEYGSIHKDISMDAYTCSGFVRAALLPSPPKAN